MDESLLKLNIIKNKGYILLISLCCFILNGCYDDEGLVGVGRKVHAPRQADRLVQYVKSTDKVSGSRGVLKEK